MQYLRWEVIPLLRSFSLGTETILGVPIASGIIAREDADTPENRTASDPITIPAAPGTGPLVLLRLEAMSRQGWIVTVGEQGTTPNAGTGALYDADDVPRIVVPAAQPLNGGRSIEVRAVKPGSVFVARMWS
ncbi:hypothetical protein [Methylobacterium oryzae]|uniref:hypothetical protein n=1 Tax=Methylobacterium oryzae TaxID=334852 RepID=UPI001F25B40B|nr:hypothetical protein [Methylobacterium oryzae]UIN36292.1 hypothetical protein LXM90_07270 [Methylobacterium oryzae]